MIDTQDRTVARFVVYLTNRLNPADTRRIVIEREPGTVTTWQQARDYAAEIIGPAWETGSVIPIIEPAEAVHVLDALDSLRALAAPLRTAPQLATIPAHPCPGGRRCECHDEGTHY
ncbi:hypothetical protein [Nocardia asiatica]|uniref:hypothetical protein n=1 Tax=Nocardia asiatica TaxID=209252 RepID=UPI00245887B4|nr:hypothetical protein [Nocardia asiatica]